MIGFGLVYICVRIRSRVYCVYYMYSLYVSICMNSMCIRMIATIKTTYVYCSFQLCDHRDCNLSYVPFCTTIQQHTE